MDIRTKFNTLYFLFPLKFLIDYDKYKEETEFEYNYFKCIICFKEYCGKHWIKLKNYNHIYCKNCIHMYISIKINENNINNILCSDLNCNFNIIFNEIKKFCPKSFS